MRLRSLAVIAAILGLGWLVARQRLAALAGEDLMCGAATALAVAGGWFLPLAAAVALPAIVSYLSRSGGRLACAAVLVFAAALSILSVLGSSWEHVASRTAAFAGAVLLVLAGICIGFRLLTAWGDILTAGERWVFAAGLGLAAISLLTFFFAWAGLLRKAYFVGLLAICLLAGAKKARAECSALWRAARQGWEYLSGTGMAAMAFISLNLAMALPAAYVPPLDYDILEYHLQLPREYLENGALRWVPHNAFSAFPQGMEMLTLLCLAVSDFSASAEPLDLTGVWMAQIVHLAFLPLLLAAGALAVCRLSRFGVSEEERGGDRLSAGLLAAALIMACGAIASLSLATPLYVEIGLAAFLCLTALAVIIAWQQAASGKAFLRTACLAGICAGAAAACKYPGLLFVGAPAALLLLAAPGFAWCQRLVAATLAGTICWLVLSPWLARNAWEAGNPLYPLGNHYWSAKAWSEEQSERFAIAHRSTDLSWQAFVAEARRIFLGNEVSYVSGDGKRRTIRSETLGALCLMLWPGLLFWPAQCRRRDLSAMVCWLLLGFALWFGYTHRLERFFAPVYILAAVVSGVAWLGMPTSIKRFAAALALAAVVFSHGLSAALYYQCAIGEPTITALRIGLGRVPPEKWLAASDAWPLRQTMLSLGRDAKIMLLGNANPAWLPAPVVYAVVFSEHPLQRLLCASATADEIRLALRRQGITHLCVNWLELARFHGTYHQAFAFTAVEQERLRDLLEKESVALLSLSQPWRLGEVRKDNRWPLRCLGPFIDAHPLLFPGGSPGGNYCRAKIELFRLR